MGGRRRLGRLFLSHVRGVLKGLLGPLKIFFHHQNALDDDILLPRYVVVRHEVCKNLHGSLQG